MGGVEDSQGVRFEYPVREEDAETDVLACLPAGVAVVDVDLITTKQTGISKTAKQKTEKYDR